MNPIVNGISQEYQGKVDVRRLNALGDGRAAFAYYRVPGHPAYVLLQPDGTRVWSDVGVKTREQLVAQLDAVLKPR